MEGVCEDRRGFTVQPLSREEGEEEELLACQEDKSHIYFTHIVPDICVISTRTHKIFILLLHYYDFYVYFSSYSYEVDSRL
jgi:hypothetical protein